MYGILRRSRGEHAWQPYYCAVRSRPALRVRGLRSCHDDRSKRPVKGCAGWTASTLASSLAPTSQNAAVVGTAAHDKGPGSMSPQEALARITRPSSILHLGVGCPAGAARLRCVQRSNKWMTPPPAARPRRRRRAAGVDLRGRPQYLRYVPYCIGHIRQSTYAGRESTRLGGSTTPWGSPIVRVRVRLP